MAYTKTTWNNLSNPPINADNLNKIEQGIYDNSLGIDKINPSGTATTTAEIEEGQVTDVIGFKSLKLKGQTSQYTTTGKNIMDGVFVQGGATNNTSTDRISCRNAVLKANTTYTLSSDLNYSNFNVAITYASSEYPLPSGTSTIYDSGWKTSSITFTTGDSNVYSNIIVRKADNSNLTPSDISGNHFQLEEGSSATSYEPYTGKKASPNPDFPQDVNNVSGDNVVGISNKNIARLELEGQVRGYTNGIPSANSNFNSYIANVKPNTTYVSSCQNISTEYNKISNLCYFDDNMNFLSGNAYNGQNKTFTTPANCKYVSMAVNKAVVNFQLEQNSTTTSYAPHQGNNFEINLGKNLIEDETFVQGAFNDSTGTKRISCRNIKLKANTTYTLSSNLDFSTYNISILISTQQFPTSTYIYSSGWVTSNFTFTTGNDDVYANITVKKIGELPLAPSDVSGNHFQLEKGAIATSYADYFPPIELCKISTYQDYIYKKDGKWFKHKEIGKVTWNGTENWQNNADISTTYVISRPTDLAQANNNVFYNYFSTVADLSTATEGARIGSSINLKNPNTTDLASFKTWLGTNNVEMYYQSTTPIDEEITYTPLIRQLDELYNSGLYDVTNISQENSSEAFILDLEACKNNINGIVEYIRR